MNTSVIEKWSGISGLHFLQASATLVNPQIRSWNHKDRPIHVHFEPAT
jgi:hypothetical protein